MEDTALLHQSFIFTPLGMHKKSGEAALKLKEVEAGDEQDTHTSQKEKDSLRSESIASLRAKAQEHIAKTCGSRGPQSTSDPPPPPPHGVHDLNNVSCGGLTGKPHEQKPLTMFHRS